MDKMSIKDFIYFLSPCFACGSKNKIIFSDGEKEYDANINDNILSCDISIKYVKSKHFSLNLNTSQLFTNYLYFFNKKIWIVLACSDCKGYSCSNVLQIKKISNINYLSSIETYIQSYFFKIKDKEYVLFSDKKNNYTTLSLGLKNQEKKYLDLPFIDTMQFKTKEKVVEKINNLLAFI